MELTYNLTIIMDIQRFFRVQTLRLILIKLHEQGFLVNLFQKAPTPKSDALQKLISSILLFSELLYRVPFFLVDRINMPALA